ncbi:MAG: ABC transporter permease subunit [Verrucomicrobiota bacterium]
MIRLTIALLLILLGLLAVVGELNGLNFPTASWFFEASRGVPLLNYGKEDDAFLWFGWLSSALLLVSGGWMLVCVFKGAAPNPVTVRRWKRFKEIKRGYYSLIIVLFLAALAALDQVIVGDEALAVRYKGEWSFPAFTSKPFKGSKYGIEGEMADAPVDYRMLKVSLKKETHKSKNRVIMPLIPYGATGDTLNARYRDLVLREGRYFESGKRTPYEGLAVVYHDIEKGNIHLRYTLRKGKLSGSVDGRNVNGDRVYTAEYQDGSKISEKYTGEGNLEAFLKSQTSELKSLKYHSAPPIWEKQNWLGTTSQGYDVLAYLYGGLQVNFKASLIYLPIVYLIGIVVGMLMGYLGGWFDLVVDRLIEVFSNMPFLFVVIIFSSMVPEQFKGLPVILSILILFGWMGITALMRTAAYRDKERDYIAAARVLGASTPRIIFHHLLPNTVAIIVTLVPFTVSSLIFSLTALDYLGFGLPPRYATWGRLLGDGLSNISAPWLISSTFFAIAGLLVLITFIGEAVREAFDPKKYTYYR